LQIQWERPSLEQLSHFREDVKTLFEIRAFREFLEAMEVMANAALQDWLRGRMDHNEAKGLISALQYVFNYIESLYEYRERSE